MIEAGVVLGIRMPLVGLFISSIAELSGTLLSVVTPICPKAERQVIKIVNPDRINDLKMAFNVIWNLLSVSNDVLHKFRNIQM